MDKQECSTCPHSDRCRDVWSKENAGPLTPVGLVVSSAVAFLLPLLVAIVAGAVAKACGLGLEWIFLLVLAGLVAGGVIAATILKIIKNRFNRDSVVCQSSVFPPEQ